MSSETTVIIHGSPWDYSHIQQKIEDARALTWQQAKWQARPALIGKIHGTSRPYSGQSFDPMDYDLVAGGWKHDHCDICWWTLHESEKEEDGVGYTDGQGNWLCLECHQHFLGKKRPNSEASAAPERAAGPRLNPSAGSGLTSKP